MERETTHQDRLTHAKPLQKQRDHVLSQSCDCVVICIISTNRPDCFPPVTLNTLHFNKIFDVTLLWVSHSLICNFVIISLFLYEFENHYVCLPTLHLCLPILHYIAQKGNVNNCCIFSCRALLTAFQKFNVSHFIHELFLWLPCIWQLDSLNLRLHLV